MAEQLLRTSKMAYELKKASSSHKDQHHQSKKQRKGENPPQIPPNPESYLDFKCSDSWTCKNSACRATLSMDDTFCKRCSCCICHLFDDNKDPSLWLECTSSSDLGDSCGLSCHIECALQRGKVGVVDLGLWMPLDGSYCCASCGKVSGILSCWKKQLIVARDARRVDVLCYRIFLSYRLLDGTSRFNELHEFVKDAKSILVTEVGLLDGVSAKMGRGIVSRLSVAAEVQKLCSLAVEKADELMASKSTPTTDFVEGSLPAACKFLFENVMSSSLVVILIELSTALDNDIKGYKLWYCKTRDESYCKDPVFVLSREQRKICISNLQPCTEYSFRIVSYTDSGDYGHSEVKCFTKSVEIIQNRGAGKTDTSKQKPMPPAETELDSRFKVRDLGRIWKLACLQEKGCLESFFNVEKLETQKKWAPSVSRELDLNVASVPDLNEEFTPAVRDEGNGCSLGHTFEADDIISHIMVRKSGEMPSVDQRSNSETQDSVSTLSNASPNEVCLDKNFEYCVKIIRWLECEGHIKKDFRLKLLTWFSLRSTEQERMVLNTFIETLIDDPSSLAGQLIDLFSDISSKRPRNGSSSILC